MYEDTKVSQLVINQLSEEKFKELLENNELDQNQLYMTDDVTHVVIEFQEPTADNGYTWYRKYADGWVEQGGLAESSYGDYDVVLPIEMSDTMYCITAMNTNQSGKDAFGWIYNKNKTTTGFTLGSRHSDGTNNYLYANWQVSGMAAQ